MAPLEVIGTLNRQQITAKGGRCTRHTIYSMATPSRSARQRHIARSRDQGLPRNNTEDKGDRVDAFKKKTTHVGAADELEVLEAYHLFGYSYLQMQKFKTLAKALTGKTVTAGRNSSGRITSFHRGGGSKRSLRDIDLKRNTCSVGIVERIEYDPNRSSRIALLRWIEGVPQKDPAYKAKRAPVNYIIASHQMEPGSMVVNSDSSKPSTTGSLMRPAHNANSILRFQELFRKASQEGEEGTDDQAKDAAGPAAAPLMPADLLDLNSKVGNCMPLSDIRMGTWVHSIELRHGQGAKLVRAAGAYAKVVKESATQCLVRLPSGVEKLIDSRCRATIGIVSNPTHGARKLRKAGHSRWLGRRPVVRGVAMNPVDHPHGGGEGRTKGGRPSVSPWGKPTKAGYRTVPKKPKAQLSRD
uniref:Large ribosomal subunit protein uL2m n=1 Tax=Aegilops tauschii TaxID=37682 RepID=M8CAQ4_AEGTA